MQGGYRSIDYTRHLKCTLCSSLPPPIPRRYRSLCLAVAALTLFFFSIFDERVFAFKISEAVLGYYIYPPDNLKQKKQQHTVTF